MQPDPDRRKESRNAAEGPVRLHPLNTLGMVVEGTLVNISSGGFRVAHSCGALAAGQVVSFEHRSGSGRARVIWTLIIGDQVQSGFLVEEPPNAA